MFVSTLGQESLTVEQQLSVALSEFFYDPLGYVMFAFPWDSEASIQQVELQSPWKERFNCKYGPDVWACKFLDDVGAQSIERGFDGIHAVDPQRHATASGHGIGKSALVAWLTKWIMDTRPHSVGTLTANTDTQLRTKTWAEVGKWHKMSITRHRFDYSTARGSMKLAHKEFPEDWKCTAQTSREENSESFAGQHAPSGTSFYIFDEASGISEKIYEVREGGLTDGEPMIFDFGNPTRNSGAFFEECIGRLRHRYTVRQIDSRTVAISSRNNLHRQWIDDYGIDSDFVKVRILGQFPSSGSLQFIPIADVETAMGKQPFVVSRDPLVLGVDVARFGSNNSVIYPRIGKDARSFPPEIMNGLDLVQLAGRVVQTITKFKLLAKIVRAVFVDGGGVGGGLVDILRNAGYPVHDVNFGGKPIDTKSYRFRGDEMWGRLKAWLKIGGCLPGPNEPAGNDLKQQLTQREFGYTIAGNKINLESKSDMEARGVQSPDVADALALTFAVEVADDSGEEHLRGNTGKVEHDYDPLEAIN